MIYRLLSCSAMLALASAQDTLSLRVPIPSVKFNTHDGVQMQQLANDSIVNVDIPLNVFSVACGTQIAALNQDFDQNSALFNQYVALAVESFSECVVPGLVSTDDLVNNRVDQVVINAELCTGPVNNNVEARQTFESLCESSTPSGSQVCDVTFYQNATYDNGIGGTYEVLLTYDTYYCIPSACSADEVERLGVAILSGLEALETPEGGENDFNVLSVCFDDNGFPLDFNGGFESYATGLQVSGTGTAQQSAASAIDFSVLSDLSPDGSPLVEVTCKVTPGISAENFAKSCCAAMNANEDFSNLRMFCDISERNGPAPYNMTIFSPFDLTYQCQADLNAQDGLPSNQPIQLCGDFNGPAGVGIQMSGETFLFTPGDMPVNELPIIQTQPPLIINQPVIIPPQQITGNGQAPPLVNLIGLDDNGVSSTRPSALVASVACAAIVVLSSRL